MDAHGQAVARIQENIRRFHEQSTPFRIYHGSTNSTRHVNFERDKIIDTSKLNHVIRVDPDRHIALVEPNVSMDQLVEATLKYGLVPPVVPEFPGITVAGAFSGTAGESSSFKHGFFDACVNCIEIILGNGTKRHASPTEASDLFYSAAGAFGTLGVITGLELQLKPTSQNIEVTYLPIHSAKEAVSLIESCTREPFDYIDGIMFSANLGVVVVGRTTRTCNYPVRRFIRARDQWFYIHAQSKVRKKRSSFAARSDSASSPSSGPDETTECVPVRDYLFRYDRGAFWMGKYCFDMYWAPFNRVTRCLLDPLLHTRKMYEALHHSGQAQRYIIQDLALPADAAEAFIHFVRGMFAIYPLWICPVRGDTKAPLLKPPKNSKMLVNVGCWGIGPGRGYGKRDFERFVADNRSIEQKVEQLGGKKWLYAQTFLSEDEFWSVYDRKSYYHARETYGAELLPDIYEKVKKPPEQTQYRKITRYRALAKTIIGKDALLGK